MRDDAEETAARNPGSEMPNNISNAALGGRVNLLKEPCQAAFEMNVNVSSDPPHKKGTKTA